MSWHEVADRCFRRRYAVDPLGFDVTVGVVVGSEGVLIIDTLAYRALGERLRDDLGELGISVPSAPGSPVIHVVNTHGHFDHCFGNAAFSPGGTLWGHTSLPGYLAETARRTLAEEFPDWAKDVADEPITLPDRLIADRAVLDLGDRDVELHHLGRGHTDGDLVVWVPDVRCAYAGDLVEESGPPAYGSDSFPLDWAETLTALLLLIGGDATVVPGHGEPTAVAFVAAQREEIALVADMIRRSYASGMSVDEALSTPGWPYDPGLLRAAVHRGYAQLGAM